MLPRGISRMTRWDRITDLIDIALTRLPDVLYRLDPEGVFVWVSPNMVGLTGHAPEQLVGTPAAALYVRPDERGINVRSVQDAAGAPVRVEIEIRHRDGGTRWVESFVCALYDGDGRFAGMEGLARDFTEHARTRRTLAESEDRFRRLSDVATEAICIHYQGKIIDFNKAFEDLFGYSRERFLDMWAWDVIAPDYVDLAKEKVRLHYEEPYEVQGLKSDGSTFPMEIYSKHSWMGERSVRVTSIRDLSERKAAEESLHLLSQAVEQSPVGVVVLDAGGHVEYANSAHQRITGYAAGELSGRPLRAVYDGKAGAVFEAMWRTLVQGRTWQGEVQNARKDGAPYWQEVDASPVSRAGGGVSHYLVVIEDVTVRKEQEIRILHQANYDALTDLPNRALALDRLAQEIARAKRVGRKVVLMFVDLDEFKAINDTLGHEYGDALLVEAAARLGGVARGIDTIARFGGDEFLVIMGDLPDTRAAERVASRIVDVFAAPFVINRRDLIATASIGLAVYPEDGDTAQTLLRNADAAMYQAKTAGRNRYCFFTPEMNESAEIRLRLEGELRRAIRSSELEVYYQPQVDIASRRVIGAEALLRWNSSVLGPVAPYRFIPIAEASGMIVPIGEMVLTQACRAAKSWIDAGHPQFRVSVNVSPRQFQEADLVDKVLGALAATGLPPQNLEIEITEGLLLKTRGETDEMLVALRAAGVRLAIDDFGTGYSSLAYLERYPFTTLKIDRLFLAGMLEKTQRRALVDSMIAMAAGLGLDVVAEGVETEEQYQHLRARQCQLAQGFLFSPAVPEREFTAMLSG